MRRDKSGWLWAFVDLLLCMVGLFVALFIVAMLQMNPATKRGTVDMPAEYVLRLTWPDKALDDIDMHLLLPNKKVVNFSTKDVDYATLDRDDLGLVASNDLYVVNGQLHTVFKNQEITTIRAIVPGTYVVNLHVYHASSMTMYAGEAIESAAKLPYKAHVTLERLNPHVTTLIEVDVPLSREGEQVTAFQFTVNADGSVTDVRTNVDVPFIPTRPSMIQTP